VLPKKQKKNAWILINKGLTWINLWCAQQFDREDDVGYLLVSHVPFQSRIWSGAPLGLSRNTFMLEPRGVAVAKLASSALWKRILPAGEGQSLKDGRVETTFKVRTNGLDYSIGQGVRAQSNSNVTQPSKGLLLWITNFCLTHLARVGIGLEVRVASGCCFIVVEALAP